MPLEALLGLSVSRFIDDVVEKHLPQWKGNRLKPGIYQGYFLDVLGNEEMLDHYFALIPLKKSTIAATLERMNEHEFYAEDIIMLDVKHYNVRFSDIKKAGLAEPSTRYVLIQEYPNMSIEGI